MRRLVRGLLYLLFVWSVATSALAAEPAFLRLDGQQLLLHPSYLGRNFVLLPTLAGISLRGQEPLMWMSPQLVHFQRIDGVLNLVQNADGQALSTMDAVPKILATFPILAASDQAIRFDFHDGALKHFFLQQPWWSEGAVPATAANAALVAPIPSLHVSGAYFRSSATGDGWFSVEEVVRLEDYNASAVFRFTFWLDEALAMRPRVDDPEDDLGYFNNRVFQFGDPQPRYLIRRWDPERTVTYYISANTPEAYRAAIRDGVLAWNAVLPRPDFLRVEIAPPNVTAGDPRYPLIQWVDNPSGLAMGMSQSHPRTGETLTALITIRSGWVDFMQQAFVNGEPAADRQAEPPLALPLAGFASAQLCQHEPYPLESAWWALDVASLDAATRTELVNRQLHRLVMHEVGHTLGLRHNFAASLDTELDLSQLQGRTVTELLADSSLPTPSASVMDYFPAIMAVLMPGPGTYDQVAITHAYHDDLQVVGTLETPTLHFCTDHQVGVIADCQQRDGGPEPIDWWRDELTDAIGDYNTWVVDNVVIPADQMDRFQPDLLTQWRILRRIYGALAGISTYEHGQTWILAGQFPFERSAKAKLALTDAMQAGQSELHPLVRPPLAQKIAELESLARQANDTGRWAQQILLNIQRSLRALPGNQVPIFLGKIR